MNVGELFEELEGIVENARRLDLSNNREAYVHFLAQTYYFVRHSVPLLELAADHSDNKAFADRCLEHVREENGHDRIARKDLKLLGEDVRQIKEWEWTQDFYKKQYELVKENGEILLGYILALEGIAACAPDEWGKVCSEYGQASKFLKIHVEEDQDHVIDALMQIERSAYGEKIFENFYWTVNQYGEFLNKLMGYKGKKVA